MADNRYREGGSWRSSGGRSDSIFSDNDRGSNRGGGGDRGFFERAGEQVRSWFGDDEGQSRRDSERTSGSSGRDERWGGGDYGGSSGGRVQSWNQAQDRGGSWQGGQSGGEQGSFGGEGGRRSPFDDHYRSWRDRQIEQLDREYDEYCRHRQQQFESEFHSWRQGRQGQGAQGGGASGASGLGGAAGGGTLGGTSDSDAASTTSGGTGMGSSASTGSSGGDTGRDLETSSTGGKARTNKP